MNEEIREHERLVETLLDPSARAEYARPYDNYKPGLLARVLASGLIGMGDFVYGEKPSYAKFKAIEVIARIPYQSWEVATYTLLTALYSNERKAVELARTGAFARIAQDNETLHVVVISQLCRARPQGFLRHWLIPLIFAFFYFWTLFILYFLSRKSSMELNYLFESHAYEQYSRFLEENEEDLKRRPIMSEFLDFYGRHVRSEYEFFSLVRNDELVHRNRSVREIEDEY